MAYTLFDYQKKAVQEAMGYFRSAKPVPSIIVAPTGAGKSLIIASTAKHTPGKLLIVQPNVELLKQNLAKYVAEGGVAGVYSASAGQKYIREVTFATLGSITKMADVFKFRGFTNIIIDEVDRYKRGDNGTLMTFLKATGITHVLGLTATPLKLESSGGKENPVSKLIMLTSKNGDPDSHFFKKIIHVTQVSELVELNRWCKIKYENHEFNREKLRFNKKRDEYTEESMRDAYRSNGIGQKILDRIADMPEKKSILVFVPSVAEAIDLASKTPRAAVIHGETLPGDRDQIDRDFKSGRIRVVYNVNVYSVGYDNPKIDCIVDGRSTSSFSWYYQAYGRGVRIDPANKEKECLYVCFSGNLDKFGRIEHIKYVKEGVNWKLYGENNMLITGIPIDQIGQHTMFTESKKRENRGVSAPMGSANKTFSRFTLPKPGDPITFPFGKFKDKLVAEAPRWYLTWWKESMTESRATEHVFKEIQRLGL